MLGELNAFNKADEKWVSDDAIESNEDIVSRLYTIIVAQNKKDSIDESK